MTLLRLFNNASLLIGDGGVKLPIEIIMKVNSQENFYPHRR